MPGKQFNRRPQDADRVYSHLIYVARPGTWIEYGYDRLAAAVGYASRRNVIRCVKKLESEGKIEVVRNPGGKNRYRVVL